MRAHTGTCATESWFAAAPRVGQRLRCYREIFRNTQTVLTLNIETWRASGRRSASGPGGEEVFPSTRVLLYPRTGRFHTSLAKQGDSATVRQSGDRDTRNTQRRFPSQIPATTLRMALVYRVLDIFGLRQRSAAADKTPVPP